MNPSLHTGHFYLSAFSSAVLPIIRRCTNNQITLTLTVQLISLPSVFKSVFGFAVRRLVVLSNATKSFHTRVLYEHFNCEAC